ncbi:hypothetical protein V6N12_018657 [Hibiscus sabdariffa]|uniref:Uncharacterized protein n=1 Tax=Hibiscus sabdariffa TaxID=183260 RepID=A0ABR1ZIA5_9ROSI
MGRLGTPSPGGRNLALCCQVWDETSGVRVSGGCYVCAHLIFVLQDLPSWLVSSDRYKVMVMMMVGLMEYGKWHSEGSVKLHGMEKWHSVGSVMFQLRKRKKWDLDFGFGDDRNRKKRSRVSWKVGEERRSAVIKGSRKEKKTWT